MSCRAESPPCRIVGRSAAPAGRTELQGAIVKRPRVLVLTLYYLPARGGVEAHAHALARWLVLRGYETLVVTTRVGVSAAADLVETVDGVHVHRVRPGGFRSQAAKWLALPFVVAALVRWRARYDVIYCPDIRIVGIAAMVVRHLLGKPLVIQPAVQGTLSCATWDGQLTRVGIRPAGGIGRALKRIGQRMYGAADAYVCASREAQYEARILDIPERRIVYQPHGVSLEEFRPAAADESRRLRVEHGWPVDRVVCLFLGRLAREKGVLDLMEAWRRLDAERALLVLVGPDMTGHDLDAGPEARAYAAHHGLADRVRFEGSTDLPARAMRAADVFVAPSRGEEFGLVRAEAMACGLPVVVSRVGGMVEYLSHRENALLCEPGRPDELASLLRQVIDDPSLRTALGRAARATAERHFDADSSAARIADVLRKVGTSQSRAAE